MQLTGISDFYSVWQGQRFTFVHPVMSKCIVYDVVDTRIE